MHEPLRRDKLCAGLRKSSSGFSTSEQPDPHSPRMSIWSWLLAGAGTWVAAVVLKVAADAIVQRTASANLPDWTAAILSGAWSSLCELGFAALAFWYFHATFADALVLALGAAGAEFVVLLIGALGANLSKPLSKAKAAATWNAFFAERAVAIAGHLASRSLMWLGIGGTAGIPAVGSALGLFATTEGIQAYGQAKEWDWLNPRTLWPFLFLEIALVGAQIVLFVLWSQH